MNQHLHFTEFLFASSARFSPSFLTMSSILVGALHNFSSGHCWCLLWEGFEKGFLGERVLTRKGCWFSQGFDLLRKSLIHKSSLHLGPCASLITGLPCSPPPPRESGNDLGGAGELSGSGWTPLPRPSMKSPEAWRESESFIFDIFSNYKGNFWRWKNESSI